MVKDLPARLIVTHVVKKFPVMETKNSLLSSFKSDYWALSKPVQSS